MAQRNDKVARYLTISMVQGAADAFVQATVDTGIIPEQGSGLEVIGMELITASDFKAIAADFSVSWSLTRDTKSAVTSYDDTEAIMFDGFSQQFTTSGCSVAPYRHPYFPVEGIFLVEPTIYGQLDSDGTGLSLTAYWRIYYREVAMSEVDILRVLNNS